MNNRFAITLAISLLTKILASDFNKLKMSDLAENTFLLYPAIPQEIQRTINTIVKKPSAGVVGLHGTTIEALSDII